MKQPQRALIWAAVSTKPQAEEDEKFSIPKQIEDGKAFCHKEGALILDVLVVPGHSRDYRSLEQLAADARKKNIDAFDRLIEHFRQRDFDFLWCRDANRFARKASLLHYIAETIIEDCDALIYSQNDGLWIDEDNVDMWATMQGFKVRQEVRALNKYRENGLIKRVERGLSTNSVPFTHILVRDERGKATHLEVNESLRRFFNDVAYLLVDERLPLNNFERALYERFGHVSKDGHAYSPGTVYKMLYHPLTWGTTAYGWSPKDTKPAIGEWMFDETIDPPDGVVYKRGAAPAVYTGDQAERVKAELLRRGHMRGKRRPSNTFAFSGLFLCNQCHYTMATQTRKSKAGVTKPVGLRCNQRKRQTLYYPVCDQSFISEKELRKFVDKLLRRLLATRDISEIFPDNGDPLRQQQIEAEIAEAKHELDTLIGLQAKAHTATQEAYQRRIDAIGERIEILDHQLVQLRATNRSLEAEREQTFTVLDEIDPIIDEFWKLESPVINQFLHRLMGRRRFVVKGKEIIGVVPSAPPKQSRRPTD